MKPECGVHTALHKYPHLKIASHAEKLTNTRNILEHFTVSYTQDRYQACSFTSAKDFSFPEIVQLGREGRQS
jgi:hypothetical protein